MCFQTDYGEIATTALRTYYVMSLVHYVLLVLDEIRERTIPRRVVSRNPLLPLQKVYRTN